MLGGRRGTHRTFSPPRRRQVAYSGTKTVPTRAGAAYCQAATLFTFVRGRSRTWCLALRVQVECLAGAGVEVVSKPLVPPLEATLGASRVLVRPGATRLHLLNPTAGWIWDAQRAGFSQDDLAATLAKRFGIPRDAALADVRDMLDRWSRAGLLGWAPAAAHRRPAHQAVPTTMPARVSAARDWNLRLADRTLTLTVSDADLANRFLPLLGHLDTLDPSGAEISVVLAGGPNDWRLGTGGVESARGSGADAALTQTLAELVEVGCRGPARLLVVHGAGIAHAERAVLLIGRGGAGKTTLAAALNAAGHPLLGDDVVPITPDGRALGIGLALCLKAGSWPVLAQRLPGLASVPIWQRLGEPVRFVPPPGPIVRDPLLVGALLFPEYVPGHRASLAPLAPEDVLQRLIAAEPYLPPLTQARLDALVTWVAAPPAFALCYPDLAQGLAQVGAALAAAEPPRR